MIRAWLLLLLAALLYPLGALAQPASLVDGRDMFLLVEAGGHRLSLFDAERRAVTERIDSDHALQGAPQFAPDGRHAFFATADGWVVKLGLWPLRVAAQARVGIDLRAIVLSGDGRWLLAGNAAPRTAVLLDAELQPVKTLAAQTLDGQRDSRVAGVLDVAARRSFVVALQDIAELWEISYDPQAPPIYDGLVHDYQMGEAIARPGYHNVRRTPLDAPLGALASGPNAAYVVGATAPDANDADGAARAVVVNLDVRRAIARLPIAGAPNPAGGLVFERQGAPVLAMPNGRQGLVSVIDAKTWRPLASLATPGPGQAVRSQPGSPYVWVDAGDALAVFDQHTLAAVAQVRGPAHARLGPVQFTHDGRWALTIAQADEGALLVYDAATFSPVARIALERPVGLYAVPAPGARAAQRR